MRTTYESAMIDVTMQKARATYDGRMPYLAWCELAVKVALERVRLGYARAKRDAATPRHVHARNRQIANERAQEACRRITHSHGRNYSSNPWA